MLMPGLVHEQQVAVSRQPERQLRSLGVVQMGQVSLPHALQQAIKAIISSSKHGRGNEILALYR